MYAIRSYYGGRTLSGEITPQGAKNEALQVLCATVLTAGVVTMHNVPDIRDVNLLIEALQFVITSYSIHYTKLYDGCIGMVRRIEIAIFLRQVNSLFQF